MNSNLPSTMIKNRHQVLKNGLNEVAVSTNQCTSPAGSATIPQFCEVSLHAISTKFFQSCTSKCQDEGAPSIYTFIYENYNYNYV